MKYKVVEDADVVTYVVVCDPGDEAVAALTQFALAERLEAAQITAVGAFEHATVGWFDRGAQGLLPGFEYRRVDVEGIAISCAVRGSDLVHDEESIAAGQKVQYPVLVLWGTQDPADPGYDPPAIWQQYAPDVRGHALPTGHFIPEEAPGLVTDALRDFLD